MKYVLHFCRNPKCNNGWIDEDLTNAKTIPPHWKYCRECCGKLGIDFNSQKRPELSEELKEIRRNNLKH